MGRQVPVRLMTRVSLSMKGRCVMTVLTRASQELFTRRDDERFSSLDELTAHCRHVRDNSQDRWERPGQVTLTSDLNLAIGDNPDLILNGWSFSQLCRMAGVHKDTLNRLSPKNPIGNSVRPSIARSAKACPRTPVNLKPWPESPAAKTTCGCSGWRSTRKCSSRVMV